MNNLAPRFILPALMAISLGGAWAAEEAAPSAAAKEQAAEIDPVEFFKRHLYPYEPIYFIAGTKSPNAKFQISLKYELFDPQAGFGQRFGPVTNLYFGYTQTSLWDWDHASAPFEDTSYKPEFFYAQNVLPRRADGWFRLDAQGGYQHESNGRDGAASRSLNLIYLKPILTFGREDSWQLSLAPRAWFYILDLSDNPDIAQYRGYADLVATIGRTKDWQLATTFRIGNHGSHAAWQFDLSYRLSRLRWLGMSWYAHAQFFTGYGEAFLHYKQPTDMFRLGFSLYR